MSLLLRKFSRSKWEFNLGKETEQFSADSITGCTRTQSNTLSVWQTDDSDFDSESTKDVIAALATSMDAPATIDVIMLEAEQLEQLGISIEETPGNTAYLDVNPRHRDLAQLNYRSLGIVSKYIVDRLNVANSYKRITKAKLLDLVIAKLDMPNTFTIDNLSTKWVEAIERRKS
ncbi:hypothetical protein WKW42_22195 [Vibrio alginolyticus]|uniref:hypothetical protein n=1 Tax=Vibrio alginolyticus TaxID=663 RepID=UPI001A2749C6|nr:hypothetical protein [Vibrio parahaemolyticus]EGR3201680.1 hypothetical protein [Vibrio parahaemolyticus]EHH1025010.1 hypothetical protein [Vibrio parahaemolyticus]EHY8548592.1 hypothetical protein [Vibrio parahaemolyticus]EIA9326422.1 hypothetical protein [Vibrio parahaemolyticus]